MEGPVGTESKAAFSTRRHGIAGARNQKTVRDNPRPFVMKVEKRGMNILAFVWCLTVAAKVTRLRSFWIRISE